MGIALVLEMQSSKTRILETYLQTAYFGHGAFGISRAAATYFQKLPEQLTLSEAALLASILPSPERLSPLRDRTGAEKRLQKVLSAMHTMGYLKEGELELALQGGLPGSLAATPQQAKGRGLPASLTGMPAGQLQLPQHASCILHTPASTGNVNECSV